MTLTVKLSLFFSFLNSAISCNNIIIDRKLSTKLSNWNSFVNFGEEKGREEVWSACELYWKKIFRRNNISTFTCRFTRWRGNTECLGSRRRSSSGTTGRFGVSKRERKLTARFHISTIRCRGSPSRSIIWELSAWNLTSTSTSRWTGGTRLSIKCTMRFLGYGKIYLWLLKIPLYKIITLSIHRSILDRFSTW